MARRGENIYKRKDGRYEGRYIKQYDPDGKAVYGYVYDKTYTGVKEKLNRKKYAKNKEANGSNMLLSEWFTLWVERETDIKESTRQLYRRHLANHIFPKLGKVQLKRLCTEMLQDFVDGLNLSASTIKLVFNILESGLRCAEKKELISNISSNVRLPKIHKRDIDILTPKEQSKLESVLLDKNDIGIYICLYTGIRIGELCALRWKDVDLENKVIHIRGTQTRHDGKLIITTPKSNSSVRNIPIPDCLFSKIKGHKNNSEFVISNNGHAVDVRVYRRHFKKLLKKAGLPDIKYHALRHTFSTRALEVGMDYKTLSEILGHASVAITMDLYVHSLDEHKKNQINKLNQICNSPSE